MADLPSLVRLPRTPTAALTKAGRETKRDLAKVEQDALIRATRVHGIAFVTEVAHTDVAHLSSHEAILGRNDPIVADRLRLLSDTATVTISKLIADAGWG